MRARRSLWVVVTAIVVGVLVLPVALVAVASLNPSPASWRALWEGPLPEMLSSTFLLLAGVGVSTLVVGAGLAWLVTAYDFPGVRFFSWALVLPLAMPAYILGFVFLAVFDFPGPVQSALRSVFGPDVWFPEVRSLPAAILVLSLTLYPYVYVLARSSLRRQVPSTFETARLLGDTRLQAARRVVLPLSRPALAAGLAVVMMETLTDFATVQYFNVNTISVGVYQVWRGMFDREVAIELAGLVLVVALLVIGVERGLRGGLRFHQRGAPRDFERSVIVGPRRFVATGVASVVLAMAVGIPVVQLLVWSLASTGRVSLSRVVETVGNSLGIALMAAIVCVVVAVIVAGGSRLSGSALALRLRHLATVGYAVPGPVVAIGVLAIIGAVTGAVSGGATATALVSLLGLVYAYVVRFVAVAYGAVDAGLESITPSVVDAAHTLGSGPAAVLRRIHLPMVRSGAVAGLVLVMVDVLKELPLVLLIRPFGFTTTAVWVWELASESRWESAAVPALLIVAIATIPVVISLRRSGPSSTIDEPSTVAAVFQGGPTT